MLNLDQQPLRDIITSDRVTGDLLSKMDGDEDHWGLPTNTRPSGTIFGRFKVRVMDWFKRSPPQDDSIRSSVPKIVVTHHEVGGREKSGRKVAGCINVTEPSTTLVVSVEKKPFSESEAIGASGINILENNITNKGGGEIGAKMGSLRGQDKIINEEQLSKAREDVITEVRARIAKDRGRCMQQHQEITEEASSRPSRKPVPPPIPPTKAIAVAKIRQAIAEARKQEIEKEVVASTTGCSPKEFSKPKTDLVSATGEEGKPDLIKPSTNVTETISESVASSAVKASAVSKLKQAILAAAAEQREVGDNGLSVPSDSRLRRRSFPLAQPPVQQATCQAPQSCSPQRI